MMEVERENLALLKKMEGHAIGQGESFPRQEFRTGLPGGAHTAINRRKKQSQIDQENFVRPPLTLPS